MTVVYFVLFVLTFTKISCEKPPYVFTTHGGKSNTSKDLVHFITFTMPSGRCEISFENPDNNAGIKCELKQELKVIVYDYEPTPAVIIEPDLSLIRIWRQPNKNNVCMGEAYVEAMKNC